MSVTRSDSVPRKPASIAEYIRAAPAEAQPHLKRLHSILRSGAPHAQEAIKWGTPFFVEPRFLFAFSAYKRHVSFAPGDALEAFREELRGHQTTKFTLKIPFSKPLPEDLIRRMAEYRVRTVAAREDDSCW